MVAVVVLPEFIWPYIGYTGSLFLIKIWHHTFSRQIKNHICITTSHIYGKVSVGPEPKFLSHHQKWGYGVCGDSYAVLSINIHIRSSLRDTESVLWRFFLCLGENTTTAQNRHVTFLCTMCIKHYGAHLPMAHRTKNQRSIFFDNSSYSNFDSKYNQTKDFLYSALLKNTLIMFCLCSVRSTIYCDFGVLAGRTLISLLNTAAINYYVSYSLFSDQSMIEGLWLIWNMSVLSIALFGRIFRRILDLNWTKNPKRYMMV